MGLQGKSFCVLCAWQCWAFNRIIRAQCCEMLAAMCGSQAGSIAKGMLVQRPGALGRPSLIPHL